MHADLLSETDRAAILLHAAEVRTRFGYP